MEQNNQLTEQEALNKLRILSAELSTTLGLSQSEIKDLVKQNPALLHLDMDEAHKCLSLLVNKYGCPPRLIVKMLSKRVYILESEQAILDAEKRLTSRFYLNNHRFGVGLLLNPRVVKMSDIETEKYIQALKNDCQVSERFVRNLFMESMVFGHSFSETKGFTDPINKRLYILEIFGLKREQLEAHSSIVGNNTSSIRNRLKMALLNDLSLEDFASGHFKFSENVIWAKMQARENGQYPTDKSIYVSTLEFNELSELPLSEAIKLYPFDKDALSKLDDEFAKKFPEIDQKLKAFYKSLMTDRQEEIITKYYMESKNIPTSPAETETPISETEEVAIVQDITKNKEYQLSRAMRILGINKSGLDALGYALNIEEFNDKNLHDILCNFVTLKKYGFESPEILAYPKCLKLPTETLELRIKLAKINGRTNRQFLTRDYNHHQDTIFARTCGIKILTRKDVNVYESEARFAQKFGGDSETLKRLCVLDERGIQIINSMYEKLTPQTTDESENE